MLLEIHLKNSITWKWTFNLIWTIIFCISNVVNCEWSSWSTSGNCTKSCGGGKQLYVRSHLVTAKNGGQQCLGNSHKFENCNTQSCCQRVQCVTTCKANGTCKVKIVNGPPGPLSGSCFPPDFGGSCTGIPPLCQKGNNIQQQCGTPCKEETRNV